MLWLDDQRPTPSKEWISFKMAPLMIDFLDEVLLGEDELRISLDHDLGACEVCQANHEDRSGFGLLSECPHNGNGYDVLKYIEEAAFNKRVNAPLIITVHSDNASARVRMESAIKSIHRFLASS